MLEANTSNSTFVLLGFFIVPMKCQLLTISASWFYLVPKMWNSDYIVRTSLYNRISFMDNSGGRFCFFFFSFQMGTWSQIKKEINIVNKSATHLLSQKQNTKEIVSYKTTIIMCFHEVTADFESSDLNNYSSPKKWPLSLDVP